MIRVVLMGAWDSLKGQRSKLQGYMSESVLNFVQFVLGVLRVSSALQSTDRSNEPSPFAIWFELVKPVAKK